LLLRSPDVSVEQLTSIICTDLGLYAYIMKLINSSHYGMKSRIQDIDQAVMLLGATSLRAILCGLKLANALSALVDEKLCFEVFSLGVQRSQAVAKLGQHYRKNELFMNDCCVAALFQDFGKLILSVCLGDPYDALLQKSRVGTVPLIDLEREAYGCTHAEAGAYLLSLWSFPPSVVESICSHEDLRGPIEGEPQSIEDFVYAKTGMTEYRLLSKRILCDALSTV
jgi:HD-like signal output (HDOD) protein